MTMKRKAVPRTQRKRWPKKFKNDAPMARIAKKVMLRNSETKRNVAGFNEQINTEGFSAWDMTVIAQGDEIFERQGRQVLATSIKKNLWFRNNSFLEPIVVRTLVLQAKDGNTENIASGTAIFNKTLLPDDNRASWNQHAGQQKLQAIVKPIDSTKWIVREDKVFTLGSANNPNLGTSATDPIGAVTTERMAYHDGLRSLKLNRSSVKMKNRKLHFDSEGDCENRLHFVVMCCQADGYQFTGSSMAVVGNLCLYYKDP
mmetsp:Transcript_15766/g.24604  ORF Transcript_15766/g.24604 Transcript_15766/m.24604 type:complete len:258 (-) Transcript_15766:49-822(-)